MKLYREEWECAVGYQQQLRIPRLTDEQMTDIRRVGKRLAQWTQQHTTIHNLISLIVLGLLFASDIIVVGLAPRYLLHEQSGAMAWWATLLGISAVHGFIFYSVIIFTMHEGAAHRRVIIETGPWTRRLAVIVNNLNRLFFADPVYYRSRHTHHHHDFATQNDGAFTNFVLPARFWKSLIPFAGALDFNDYRIHSDTQHSKSRTLSMLMGISYSIALGCLLVARPGLLFAVLVLVVLGPWFSFLLDRLRETTEHNLMALETDHGARNFGWDVWGLLVGGGPWGQTCHLSHHLVPSLPWYQQYRLHRHMNRILSPEQKRYFNVTPLLGYPGLLVRLLTTNHRIFRQWKTAHSNAAGESQQHESQQHHV